MPDNPISVNSKLKKRFFKVEEDGSDTPTFLQDLKIGDRFYMLDSGPDFDGKIFTVDTLAYKLKPEECENENDEWGIEFYNPYI